MPERERERERERESESTGRRTTAEIEAGDVTDRRDWAALESSGKRRRAEICRREGERERAEAPDDGRPPREKLPTSVSRSVRREISKLGGTGSVGIVRNENLKFPLFGFLAKIEKKKKQ
jgi:hypothetical protein